MLLKCNCGNNFGKCVVNCENKQNLLEKKQHLFKKMKGGGARAPLARPLAPRKCSKGIHTVKHSWCGTVVGYRLINMHLVQT